MAKFHDPVNEGIIDWEQVNRTGVALSNASRIAARCVAFGGADNDQDMARKQRVIDDLIRFARKVESYVDELHNPQQQSTKDPDLLTEELIEQFNLPNELDSIMEEHSLESLVFSAPFADELESRIEVRVSTEPVYSADTAQTASPLSIIRVLPIIGREEPEGPFISSATASVRLFEIVLAGSNLEQALRTTSLNVVQAYRLVDRQTTLARGDDPNTQRGNRKLFLDQERTIPLPPDPALKSHARQAAEALNKSMRGYRDADRGLRTNDNVLFHNGITDGGEGLTEAIRAAINGAQQLGLADELYQTAFEHFITTFPERDHDYILANLRLVMTAAAHGYTRLLTTMDEPNTSPGKLVQPRKELGHYFTNINNALAAASTSHIITGDRADYAVLHTELTAILATIKKTRAPQKIAELAGQTAELALAVPDIHDPLNWHAYAPSSLTRPTNSPRPNESARARR